MSGDPNAYALVTGASRGLGAAFARAFAAQGRNLILSARSLASLQAVRDQLPPSRGDVICLAADLRSGGAQALAAEVFERGLTVDLLINNAGLGSGGRFVNLTVERELEEVEVNIAALVALTHAFVPAMCRSRSGAVVQVASTAGFQPVPYMATYAGTKAFVLSFSQALREELRETGVHVMALCPGPIRTEFFSTAGIRPRGGPMQSPEAVVELALQGLRERRGVVVCGLQNRMMVAAERWLPRQTLTRLVGRVIARWQIEL